VAFDLTNLAEVYVAQQRYPEAESFYKMSLAIEEKTFPPNHISLLKTMQNYAALLRRMGRTQEAEAWERKLRGL
jgi:tetratricopeptide (TPR) repeat protein